MAESEQADRRMLVSLAHPDDESFGMAGTIARYANEGVAVSLICATNGDVGSADSSYTEKYETMADLRLDELHCAAEELGFSKVYTFGYRDSGMSGTPDNNHPDSLYAAELIGVVRRITRVIRAARPQVVVTFDPYGGYGHPDHVKMHRATTKAFHAAGDPAKFPQHFNEGLEPYQPQKLYYMTFDRRFMQLIVWLMPLVGQDPSAMGRNKDIDFREIAEHSYPIHARISTRRVAAQAERARACHESQLGGFGTGIIQHLRELLTGRFTDTFMRAYPVANGRGAERDLFEGVDATR
jgi:LmbE family N-acetylglucosaminyl deacetylase